MVSSKIILAVFALLMLACTASAQYYGGMYGMNYYPRRRRPYYPGMYGGYGMGGMMPYAK
ncbi:unnamed protein product, partial [Cylicocyclus nassatus]